MKLLKIILQVYSFLYFSYTGYCQDQKLNYQLRGVVVDEITQEPLIGALIFITGKENSKVVTDLNGDFVITDMEIGRSEINVSYIGYENFKTIFEIKSGKETVLNILMKESLIEMEEVVITSQTEKSKPINSMAYASTRTFSVEESNKFAGAVDDPARMALSYAGVVAADDGNNYMSIRGNNPSTLLWKLEGIDIPNPNHYASSASSGGGISALSSQLLTTSDFSTGAFSAEYGNAIGGVFDLKLRRGNNQKREFTFKAGALGIEAAIEGPISKKYKSSFLINYRYSTLSLLDKLGLDFYGILDFSDLSYNINLPIKKSNVSFFGLHGRSSQKNIEFLDSTIQRATYHHVDYTFKSNVDVDGLKFTSIIGKSGFLNSSISYAQTINTENADAKTIYPEYTYFEKYIRKYNTNKVSWVNSYTQKLNSKAIFRIGSNINLLGYQILNKSYKSEMNMETKADENGNTTMLQSFAQLQYKINSKWSTNIGTHFLHLFLNNKASFEPRGNIQYEINAKSSIAMAYGNHSQIQPLGIYFIKDVSQKFINKNLEPTKAHHYVLSYNFNFNTYTRFKSEVYYQYLYDIPVGQNENKFYAIINQQFEYPTFELVNKGIGKNKGIEITLEQFMHNNWYYIITSSLSDSKYKTPSSDWLNTRYNTQYAFIGTIGKEWIVGKTKRNVFGLNIKSAFIGGQRYTPLDKEASLREHQEILIEEKSFTQKAGEYFKLDIGIKYKRNHRKYTSSLSLDVLNATAQKNIAGMTYNEQLNEFETLYQMPLVPIISYKVEF